MPETVDSIMKAYNIYQNLHSFMNFLKVRKATSWHIQQEHVQMPETVDSMMKAHNIYQNLHSVMNFLKVRKATSWHI